METKTTMKLTSTEIVPIDPKEQAKLIKAQKFSDAVTAILATGDKPFVGMQHFTALLNVTPQGSDIKKRQGNSYVPIGVMEARLDQFFFGEWHTRNFTYQREFNEMVGSLELVCTNPITDKEIVRVGAASIQIMQDANTNVNQFNDTKKKNALEAGFPKLKAECFTNACRSLGAIFGRNLNRDKYGEPTPIIKQDEPLDINRKPDELEQKES